MIIKDTAKNNNYSLTQSSANSTNVHKQSEFLDYKHNPKRLRTDLTKPLHNFPPVIYSTVRKIEWIADKSKWWWHFAPQFRQWLYCMRSERREAILLVLKAMAVKMDAHRFECCLMPGVNIRHAQLIKLTGLSRARYYRALDDLKAKGYVKSWASNKLDRNGEYRGFAGVKRLSLKLFRHLKLDKIVRQIEKQIELRNQSSTKPAKQSGQRPSQPMVFDFEALQDNIDAIATAVKSAFKRPP